MPRPALKPIPTVSEQLEKLLGYPWPFPGRPPAIAITQQRHCIGLWAGKRPVTKLGAVGGGYRRDHLRALAQRLEVSDGEVRIMGSKSRLLQTLVANGGATAVLTQGLSWRRG